VNKKGGNKMLAVDKNTFQEEVLEADGFVLVDYWSDGCEPCKALMPDIEALAEQFDGKVKFTKLNTTKARRLAIGQRVLGLPTIALYKGGEKIAEVTKDDANKANIEAMLTNNIG
jgi:thioredoxin 1